MLQPGQAERDRDPNTQCARPAGKHGPESLGGARLAELPGCLLGRLCTQLGRDMIISVAPVSVGGKPRKISRGAPPPLRGLGTDSV